MLGLQGGKEGRKGGEKRAREERRGEQGIKQKGDVSLWCCKMVTNQQTNQQANKVTGRVLLILQDRTVAHLIEVGRKADSNNTGTNHRRRQDTRLVSSYLQYLPESMIQRHCEMGGQWRGPGLEWEVTIRAIVCLTESVPYETFQKVNPFSNCIWWCTDEIHTVSNEWINHELETLYNVYLVAGFSIRNNNAVMQYDTV